MMKSKVILVAGGDLRYVYTAKALAAQHQVHTIGLPEHSVMQDAAIVKEEALPRCDVLVLPMPVSEDGTLLYAPLADARISLTLLRSAVMPGGMVFGGKFGSTEPLFRQAGLRTLDYFSCEELSVRNAVPTAEGALEILLKQMPATIFGSRMLVLGFGRVGSRLAAVLHGLGARVTVASREYPELARAAMLGCRTLPLAQLKEHAGEFSVLCNTIPARVIAADILAELPAETLVLDLASRPGGVDWEAPARCQRIHALSLPGKTAPAAAGRIIADTIIHRLQEEEDTAFC